MFRTSGGRNSLSTSGHLAGQSSKGSELTSRAAPPWLSHSSFCMWGSDRHGQPPRGDALELSMGKGRGHRFAQGACSSQAHEHWAEAERALLACVPLQGTCPSPRVPFPNRLVDTSTTRSTVGRGRSHPRPTAGEALTSTGAQAGGASRSFYGERAAFRWSTSSRARQRSLLRPPPLEVRKIVAGQAPMGKPAETALWPAGRWILPFPTLEARGDAYGSYRGRRLRYG